MSITIERNEVTNVVSDAFNFEVLKMPLTGPDNMSTDRGDGSLYSMFRNDTWERVGDKSITRRYKMHTSEQIIRLCHAASLAFEGKFSVKCHFNDGHYVEMTPSNEYRKWAAQNDTVVPSFLLSAPYNGLSLKATIGVHRDACDNLLLFHDVCDSSVKIRHSSLMESKMNTLINTFHSLREKWSNVQTVVEHLNGKETHIRRFLEEFYDKDSADNKGGKKETMVNDRINAIVDRIENEQKALGLGVSPYATNWLLYNGIQGYYQHDSIRREATTDFDMMLKSNSRTETSKALDLLLA